jgi:hypothetical protein
MALLSNPRTERMRSFGSYKNVAFFAIFLITESVSVYAQDAKQTAQTSSVEVSWIAPAECPQKPWLEGEIEKLIGRPLTAIAEPSIKAAALVEKKDGGKWRLRLHTLQDNASGERELEADRCEALAQAAALILALSIDPQAVKAHVASSIKAQELATGSVANTPTNTANTPGKEIADKPAPPQPEQQPVVETPKKEIADKPAPPEPKLPSVIPPPEPVEQKDKEETVNDEEDEPGSPIPIDFISRLDFVGDYGALPDISIGPSAAVGLAIDRLDALVSIKWLPSDETQLSKTGFGAEFGLWAIGIGVYYRFLVSELTLSPFLQLELGEVYGKGANVNNPDQGSALWLAMAAGLRLSLRLTDWASLGLEIGPNVPFLRPNYVLDISGIPQVVHQSSSMGVGTRLGFELRL